MASPLPLFVYGSLRDPRVRRRVLGLRADVATMPAILGGHARVIVPSFGYPFLVPTDDGSSVDGELLLGLTADDYIVLDSYEDLDDGLYVRDVVTVQTANGPREAFAYLRGPNAPQE